MTTRTWQATRWLLEKTQPYFLTVFDLTFCIMSKIVRELYVMILLTVF